MNISVIRMHISQITLHSAPINGFPSPYFFDFNNIPKVSFIRARAHTHTQTHYIFQNYLLL